VNIIIVFVAKLKIECRSPKLIKRSLDPDIRNDDNIQTNLRITKKAIIIEIKSKKLSYLKAIINSYLSLISTLREL
jgi:tRNA threonylcarbamoyladenosine modification (KEOPS) complex  Pcc1 subunit